MRKDEVPQDTDILEQWNEVSYAVDSDGNYVLVPSAGWRPANLANRQAWQLIVEELKAIIERVNAGQASPLAYHMARAQMDAALLGRYVGLSGWRVRRHLRPAVFARLSPAIRERYARALGITTEQLAVVPAAPETPFGSDP